jgi:hypothetical protein
VLPVCLQLLVTFASSDAHRSVAQNLLHQTNGNSVFSFHQKANGYSTPFEVRQKEEVKFPLF